MSILVTGGAGYIGSHGVRLLLERGRDVVVFDSMEFGHRAAVGDVPLVKGDVGESMSTPERCFGNNVAGGASLIGPCIGSG